MKQQEIIRLALHLIAGPHDASLSALLLSPCQTRTKQSLVPVQFDSPTEIATLLPIGSSQKFSADFRTRLGVSRGMLVVLVLSSMGSCEEFVLQLLIETCHIVWTDINQSVADQHL